MIPRSIFSRREWFCIPLIPVRDSTSTNRPFNLQHKKVSRKGTAYPSWRRRLNTTISLKPRERRYLWIKRVAFQNYIHWSKIYKERKENPFYQQICSGSLALFPPSEITQPTCQVLTTAEPGLFWCPRRLSYKADLEKINHKMKAICWELDCCQLETLPSSLGPGTGERSAMKKSCGRAHTVRLDMEGPRTNKPCHQADLDVSWNLGVLFLEDSQDVAGLSVRKGRAPLPAQPAQRWDQLCTQPFPQEHPTPLRLNWRIPLLPSQKMQHSMQSKAR